MRSQQSAREAAANGFGTSILESVGR
ncbi:MAG: hypothetical protein QOG76_4674, partial [Pseudonocardiales bacterium]|nr:hypothetical protein [Pseudonocardiales bacterium]